MAEPKKNEKVAARLKEIQAIADARARATPEETQFLLSLVKQYGEALEYVSKFGRYGTGCKFYADKALAFDPDKP